MTAIPIARAIAGNTTLVICFTFLLTIQILLIMF
jgi:hypothetical protein